MLPTVMEVTIAVNSSLELNQIVSLVKGTGSKLSEHILLKREILVQMPVIASIYILNHF